MVPVVDLKARRVREGVRGASVHAKRVLDELWHARLVLSMAVSTTAATSHEPAVRRPRHA